MAGIVGLGAAQDRDTEGVGAQRGEVSDAALDPVERDPPFRPGGGRHDRHPRRPSRRPA